ncbi:hypothetical protein BZT13_25865 [Salmonella enterica subsp. enterica]|uniref:Uncharacterized protein n=2 Tax=Salmonella enterica I TaxID=59201 RepID=A0A636GFW2_SALET|nr:hypothetical protein [Salmonella enterica subsp. enterica serovar Newport]EAS1839122.1 hypothetical protein [Salmonella enterica]EBR9320627.1 hypothetical protein [Salmonella enterica subsp. enterica serovar Panama]EBV1877457.1 hypothetical protein [Salmonella enterica subsp. enterica serovar Adelaide]EBV7092029.1 hypothetical protein [Salmonella enterica subsp. enterica serovar Oranienburg]EBV8523444.1 hypothetical protein [Salmonella enterica subsp. enterica serovar Larochelle]EBW7256061
MMADLPPVRGYQHSTKLSDIILPEHGLLEAVIMSGLAGSFPIIRGMNKVTGRENIFTTVVTAIVSVDMSIHSR